MGWEVDGAGYDYSASKETVKKSAKEYAKAAGSSYRAKAGRTGLPLPLGRTVSTESPTPIVFVVDVTGSMGKWPGIIFHKLPVLYNEARLWLPETAISFAAVGDAFCDTYPVQVCDFATGRDLEGHINSILPESGGGGGYRESYELFAWFYARHCSMPKAKKALLVYCGDEGFYDTMPRQILEKCFGDKEKKDVDSYAVFQELMRKFEVYNLRVTYNSPETEVEIRSQWEKALGPQRVLRLEDPNRVVDCVLGLTALVAQDYGQFKDRLEKRQTAEQVEQVVKTLHPLLKGSAA